MHRLRRVAASFAAMLLLVSAPLYAQRAAAPPSEAPAGQLAFGVDLYRQLATAPGNVFLSPASLSTAFGLAYAGARGATAAEITRVLRYPERDVHAQMSELLKRLPLDQPGRKVSIANALWVQQGFAFHPDYLSLTRDHYAAAPRQVDFQNAPAEAANAINRWADESTAGRITKVVSDLPTTTRLILTNAVYFKADWARPFDANRTTTQSFTRLDGSAVETAFMTDNFALKLLDRPGFQAVEIPYLGDELSMMLFLPKAAAGLPELEQKLSGATLGEWIAALRAARPSSVELTLPKIKLDARYALADQLKAMGMQRAFSQAAEFGGISDAAPLMLSDVLHQTFLLVDEQGTEAAATTAIGIVVTSGPRIEHRFRADHPFFFLVRDNRSGAVLFMGRITDPPRQG